MNTQFDTKMMRRVDSLILLGGGFSIVLYFLYQSYSTVTDSYQFSVVSWTTLGMIFLSGWTFFPFYIFYLLSSNLHSKKPNNKSHMACLAVSIILVLGSYILYYDTSKVMEDATGSTASLGYGVFPIYILIVGLFCYWVISSIDTRNA